MVGAAAAVVIIITLVLIIKSTGPKKYYNTANLKCESCGEVYQGEVYSGQKMPYKCETCGEEAIPVYADIDPHTYNIDPEQIEKKITSKTKAVYVVHYGGQMCDMDPIMKIAGKHNLYVLEDCAHTPGAEYKGRKAGSIGDLACFSFHSLKNMTTLGRH